MSGLSRQQTFFMDMQSRLEVCEMIWYPGGRGVFKTGFPVDSNLSELPGLIEIFKGVNDDEQ